MKALITGAAKGIGYELAKKLATTYETIILSDIDKSKLTKAADTISEKSKCKCFIFPGDLTDRLTRMKLIEYVNGSEGNLDLLVNNAGITNNFTDVKDTTERWLDKIMDINFKVPYLLSRDFLDQMIEQRSGMIVNIASSANIEGYQGQSVYAASKAALCSLTDSIAKETASFDSLKAFTIIPSRTDTSLNQQLRGKEESSNSQSAEFVASIISKVIAGDISAESGDDIRIKEGDFLVESYIGEKNFN